MTPLAGRDWREQLQAQLDPILLALAAGDDVAPARVYRAEGYAQALVELGIAPCEAVLALLRERYAALLGDARAACFAPGDFQRGELPAIPWRLPRAPVYPGTA